MAVQSANDFFQTQLPARLNQDADLASKINASYKFEITGAGGGTWVLDLTKPAGQQIMADAQGTDAMCTVTLSDGDFVDMVNGKANPQMLFMSGKLKVAGDMGLALKLGSFLG